MSYCDLLQEPLTVIYDAYYMLATTVVHLEQAKEDEEIHEHSHRYTDNYVLLAHHVYTKLCSLHSLLYAHNRELPDVLVEKVRSVVMSDVNTRALRHTRDSLVLKDLKHILHRIERQFMALANQHNVMS